MMADRKTMVHKNHYSKSAGTMKSESAAGSYKSGNDKGGYVKRKDSGKRDNNRNRVGGVVENTWQGEGKKPYRAGNTGNWRDKADHNKGSYGRSGYAHNKEGSDRNGESGRSGYTRGNENRNGDGRSSYATGQDRRSSEGKGRYGSYGNKRVSDTAGSDRMGDDNKSRGEGVKKSYRSENAGNFGKRNSNGRSNYAGRSTYGDRQKNGMGRAENDRQDEDRPRRDSQGRNRTSRGETNKDGRYDSRENSHGKRNYDTKDTKQKTIGCPIYEKCGGCLGQEEPYDVNLAKKQGQLEELLSEFCVVDPIIGMGNPNHYRNKVHAVFDHDRENPICGVYEEGTHKVIPIEDCRIENQKASAIIISIRDLLKSFKIKTFDENSGHGLMRHVLVRTGLQSGEIMVVLVLASLIMPSKNNFVRALLKLHPEITTIIINENYRKTSIILGEKEQIIYGKGFIQDTLCGKIFRILPKSFYQINPVQSEVLYKKAISYAELTGTETILDAYCGIGTIGMIASEQAEKVISVELNADAIRDARYNAKKNEITNIDFYAKDAGEFMSQVAEEDSQQIDVVFMDPPRNGSDEKFMDAMIKLNPKKIIYISCNPFTLARDLEYLCQRGYEAKKIAGIDLLPWTKHVETVVLLSKLKSAKSIEVKIELDEMDLTTAESKATYDEIKQYVFEHTGLKVSQLYVAQVKRKHGLIERINYNVGDGKSKVPQVPVEKEKAIEDALRYFKMIS